MRKERIMVELYFTVIGIIFVVIALSGATYAWFTQTASVNTDVYSASVDGGDSSLLISVSEDGEFDESCDLIPDIQSEYLYPVSSSDLVSFYASAAVRADGVTVKYEQADIDNSLISGSVYLKSVNGTNDVYFDDEKFMVGMDDQKDAGLRLGLVIHDQTYIFDMDNGEGDIRNTIEADNASVVSSIDEDGKPVYVDDMAMNIKDYQAQGEAAGSNALVRIEEDEVVQVKYFVYMEGCDDNCFNVIQNKQLSITLGFQGVSVNEQ